MAFKELKSLILLCRLIGRKEWPGRRQSNCAGKPIASSDCNGAESWSGTIGVELADATAQTDHYIAAFGFRIEEMRHIALISF